jgi:general secretion pathway protein G
MTTLQPLRRLLTFFRDLSRRGQRGMTLIEIMVVITIIGLIASAVGVAVMNQLQKAKEQSTKVQIKNFESALEHYKLAFGKYPSGSEGLRALVNPPNNEKAFMKELPQDPWGGDYVYLAPGLKNPDSYDIYSKGGDGVEGGAGDGQDIGNWNMGDL